MNASSEDAPSLKLAAAVRAEWQPLRVVILSGGTGSQSEPVLESKDPYQLERSLGMMGYR